MIANLLILTEAQKETVLSLNPPPPGVRAEPRLIDAVNPGVGINLNDSASAIIAGAVVALTGKYIIPASLINNPLWSSIPSMIEFCLTLPICMCDTDIIFLPPEI